MNDLVIRGARVVDGTGAPWFRADVAVREGRVAEVGRGLGGRVVLDAHDRVLAPGFVDLHSHGDVLLLDEPEAAVAMKAAQGVTTELLAQDGISVAPALPGREALVERIAAELDGQPRDGCRWRSLGAYLDRLDGATPVNVACLVPHGTLRAQLLDGEDRAAGPAEVDALRRLVAEGMADGAMGLSTGLEYAPSRRTAFAELRALLEVVAAAGGVHVSHIRDYDRAFDAAIDEMVALSAATGVPAHFSHFVAWGRRNHGRMGELLERLEAARRAGVDATLDVYPYAASSTVATYFLADELRDLPAPRLLERLRSPDERARAAAVVDAAGPNGVDVAWDAFEVASGLDALAQRDGRDGAAGARRLPELAAARGGTVGELLCDLVAATDGRALLIVHACREDDVATAVAHRLTSIGSDGVPVGEAPHPRGWGSFARVLATYAGADGALALEQAVAAMSGRAAARLGLCDRGLVRPGLAADLVLFDPAAVAAPASFATPRAPARGFDLVLVGGRAVWREGAATGDLPGRALRRRGR